MLKAIAAAILAMTVATSAWAQCTVPNTLTNGTNADATQVMANFSALLTCINSAPPPSGGLTTAQGRLTLASGVPVMASTQTGKTTIYYTPYVGNQIQIYDGTAMTSTAFNEITNVTTNGGAGGGPAAAAANSNYDLFVWSSSGTVTLTRGPAWTNDTTRSSALQRVNGIWTNQSAITNGPGANLGTFVGTIRTDGSSQVNWILGAVAPSGTAAVLGVWNAYNRVNVSGFIGDSTSSWAYTAATWRPANNSTTERVSFIVGLQEDAFSAEYTALAGNGVAGGFLAGVGFNSTTAAGGLFVFNTATSAAPVSAQYNDQPAIGFNYCQALEKSQAAGTTTWYGSNSAGGIPSQSGLAYSGRF